MQGVFLDLESLDRNDLDLQPLHEALPQWRLYPNTRADAVTAAISDAEVVISNKVMLDRAALLASTGLQLVCIAATGTNNVDLATARECNITVCNVTGYTTRSVVEHVFGQLLTLYRQLTAYRDAVHAGRWQQAEHFCLLEYPIRELSGQTLGIIGYGELGQAVARMGEAFGMRVLVAERANSPVREGRTALDIVLSDAHVISLHCPLTDATRNLIGGPELARMRDDAILINTARGGIVDEPALLEALETEQIAAAIVDVLSEEPPRSGNPLLDSNLPNLLVTPHIAWASLSSRQRLVNEIAANILAWRNGTPRNIVAA